MVFVLSYKKIRWEEREVLGVYSTKELAYQEACKNIESRFDLCGWGDMEKAIYSKNYKEAIEIYNSSFNGSVSSDDSYYLIELFEIDKEIKND